jgi:hypothetical protein
MDEYDSYTTDTDGCISGEVEICHMQLPEPVLDALAKR